MTLEGIKQMVEEPEELPEIIKVEVENPFTEDQDLNFNDEKSDGNSSGQDSEEDDDDDEDEDLELLREYEKLKRERE